MYVIISRAYRDQFALVTPAAPLLVSSVFLGCLYIRFHASKMLKDALQNGPAPVVLQQRISDVNRLDDDHDEPFPLVNTR